MAETDPENERDIKIDAESIPSQDEILTDDALAFLAELQQRFGRRRDELLAARQDRRAEVARTGSLDFDPDTADIRGGDWKVAPAPIDLQDRRVEMTGTTDEFELGATSMPGSPAAALGQWTFRAVGPVSVAP